ncbi:MAG: cysteine synthase family protein [Aureispira sp.]|nr:cysteine synthase family protein [Aureispira sp.]
MLLTTISEIPLVQKVHQLEKQIGNTPLIPIRNVFWKKDVQLLVKLEWQQLGASVKTRPAFNIIKSAIGRGLLHQGIRLLDATSGNTGIAYAHISAVLGIPLTIVLPENASKERKRILKALGVELIYTSKFGGTDEAQEKAQDLATKYPDLYYYADQYSNPANWQAHQLTTAPEIWEQTQQKITHFVAGLGTTGTFVGTSKGLKAFNPNIQSIALQPGTALHGLEGWKHLETAKVPAIYDTTLADQHLEISTLEAYNYVKQIAKKEGLLVSPSAAANLAGAIKVAKQLDKGTVVTLFPDDASKYGEVLQQLF